MIAHKLANEYATSGHSGTGPNVIASVPPYPQVTSLSTLANFSSSRGTALRPTASGLLVQKAGDYLVSFEAVLFNPGSELGGPVTYNVFLVRNNTFSPSSLDILGVTNTVNLGSVLTFSTTGILYDVKANTELTLVVSTGGATAAPVTWFSWSINAVLLNETPTVDCCDPCPCPEPEPSCCDQEIPCCDSCAKKQKKHRKHKHKKASGGYG